MTLGTFLHLWLSLLSHWKGLSEAFTITHVEQKLRRPVTAGVDPPHHWPRAQERLEWLWSERSEHALICLKKNEHLSVYFRGEYTSLAQEKLQCPPFKWEIRLFKVNKKKCHASPFVNKNPSLSGPSVHSNSTIFNVQEILANLQKRWFKALVMLNILAHTFLNWASPPPITAWNSLCSNFSASLFNWLLHPHLSSKGLTQRQRSFPSSPPPTTYVATSKTFLNIGLGHTTPPRKTLPSLWHLEYEVWTPWHKRNTRGPHLSSWRTHRCYFRHSCTYGSLGRDLAVPQLISAGPASLGSGIPSLLRLPRTIWAGRHYQS